MGVQSVNFSAPEFDADRAIKFLGLESCVSVTHLRQLHALANARLAERMPRTEFNLERDSKGDAVVSWGEFSITSPQLQGDFARAALGRVIPKILKLVIIDDAVRASHLKCSDAERVPLLMSSAGPWDLAGPNSKSP